MYIFTCVLGLGAIAAIVGFRAFRDVASVGPVVGFAVGAAALSSFAGLGLGGITVWGLIGTILGGVLAPMSPASSTVEKASLRSEARKAA